MSTNQHEALDQYLSHLEGYLNREHVIEVVVNRPGEVFTLEHGVWIRHEDPQITFDRLNRIVKHAAKYSDQPEITLNYPLISATLPNGSRLRAVSPPATRSGHIGLAIRKNRPPKMSHDEYCQKGGYDNTRAAEEEGDEDERSRVLDQLYEEKDFPGFMGEAINQKLTTLVAGTTGGGKSWYLNSLLSLIPKEERVITLESSSELELIQPNWLPLFYARQSSEATGHKPTDLVQAAMGLSPSRIIFGELLGAEALDWLEAGNTGHPGSLATIHANTAKTVYERLSGMLLKAHTGMNLSEIQDYVHFAVDVIAYTGKTGENKWGVKSVFYNKRERSAD